MGTPEGGAWGHDMEALPAVRPSPFCPPFENWVPGRASDADRRSLNRLDQEDRDGRIEVTLHRGQKVTTADHQDSLNQLTTSECGPCLVGWAR